MEIYIETFILQNILINLCLLRLVYLTTKSNTSFLKLLTASILGTLPSIFVVSFISNILLANILKLLTAISMILTAFKQSKKQFIFNIILLFIYTYAFGGLIINISSSYNLSQLGTIKTTKFGLEITCLILVIATYIFENVVKHLKLKLNTNSLIYTITLTKNNKSIKINAYLDTGNFLNYNGKPMLILDLNAYLKLTNSNLINFFTSKMEQINTSTVSGSMPLKICNIDHILIKNKDRKITLHNQPVAINTTNCFKNTNYQALLSPLFL